MTARRFAVAVGSQEVVGVLHRPDGGSGACVVACHGMGASKDSDKYLLLAREFPRAGLALARFDFRGSGESGGLAAGATVASRMADLEAVLGYLERQPGGDGRLGLLGSSLGGFVALCVAAGRPGLPTVTWNAPADLRALAGVDPAAGHGPGPALAAEVRRGRHVEVPAGASHVLVIQGARDEVVPPAHAMQLFSRAREPRDMVLLPGADHRLSDPIHRMEAVEQSLRWLARHLGAGAA